VLTLRESTPVARKSHQCDWCYGQISPGEKYHRSTNVYDDRLYDWVACEDCTALCPDVWEWAFRPDEGIGEDSFAEWAHDHAGVDVRARAYLTRRACRCHRCPPTVPATTTEEQVEHG
jgi:hypothetical protein